MNLKVLCNKQNVKYEKKIKISDVYDTPQIVRWPLLDKVQVGLTDFSIL